MSVAVDPRAGRRWIEGESESPVFLLAAELSEDVATVFSEAFAQQVAVAGECTSCGDLLALVTEVIVLDLDVVAAHSTRTS